MAEIDQSRRSYLAAKYGIDRPPMNPALNTTVQAILDAAQIVDRQGWGRRIGAWVDPAHNPRMYDIVTRAHRNLRTAMAEGLVGYDDHAADGYPYDPDDSAVLIHFVGSNSVSVCQRPAPGRAERGGLLTPPDGRLIRPLAACGDTRVDREARLVGKRR